MCFDGQGQEQDSCPNAIRKVKAFWFIRLTHSDGGEYFPPSFWWSPLNGGVGLSLLLAPDTIKFKPSIFERVEIFEKPCKVFRYFLPYRLKEPSKHRKGEIVLEDSQIVELYWQKNADAISETANKYGAYCFTIADNILHCAEDSEECVNDTWLHTWNAIPPQRPNVFRMFLAKITRNLSFNRFNARFVEKRGGSEIILVLEELEECLASGSDVEAAYEVAELEQCICRFVRTLPERDRNVFVRRYFFTEPMSAIAERYSLTLNNATVILSRTRKKLKAELMKEGYL